jgi:GNAT superfamily N-acetyltransferase
MGRRSSGRCSAGGEGGQCNLTWPSTRTLTSVRSLRSRLFVRAGYVYVKHQPMHTRQVQPHECGLVAGVLGAAADNLTAKGRALWDSREVSEPGVEAHVRAGMYYAAFDEDGPFGVFRFQLSDGHFWPEIPDGTSAFIHKLAVHPQKQGRHLSEVLLRQACELTRVHGRAYLRLDCEGGRPGLRAVYERFGFRHHSDKVLGQQTFHRFEFPVGAADA